MMKENASEAIDDLFAKIRLQLLKLRENDPAIAEELKSLLTQLEDWVEKLVIDSLKLKSLESGSKTTRTSKSIRQKRQNRK